VGNLADAFDILHDVMSLVCAIGRGAARLTSAAGTVDGVRVTIRTGRDAEGGNEVAASS
jgi:hypothetical protein